MKAWEKRPRGDRPLAPSGLAPASPPAGSESRDPGLQPNAPSDFLIFRDRSPVPPVPGGVLSSTNEPSLANSGKFIWYTGNWYAARSTDAGVTWTYINPFADMPDFCCDQDVVYDKGRDLILWYRQGLSNAGPAAPNNRIFLGASTDGGATWCTNDLRPSQYGFNGTDWFDYPHLAVSDDYLYISSNMFNAADVFQRSVITKIPLDQLKTCATDLSFNFWADANVFSPTPIQGATDTMFVGSHINNSTFKICWNQEGDNLLNCVNKTVDTWTPTPKGTAHCPTPDGNDPCQFLDQRINAGWINRNGRENGATGQEHNDSVGFFWTVKEGSGFPFPYVNACLLITF